MNKMTTSSRTNKAKAAQARSSDAAPVVDDGGMDWAAFDALTDEEVRARALSDPDNPPRDTYPPGRLKRLPRIKVVRQVMGLSVEEFAKRFRVPAEMIPEWESGRVEPTMAEHAYFKVIAVDAAFVEKALAFQPARPDKDVPASDEQEKKAS